MIRTLFAAVGAFCLIASLGAAQDAPPSYEADYRLFAAGRLPAGVEDAYGRMRVTRRMTCASIAETQTLEAVFVSGGRQSTLTQRVSATTRRDQSGMRMTLTQRGLSGETTTRRISAERTEAGVALDFDGRSVGTAPPETLFPSAFFAQAARSAAQDEAGFEALLFDGAGPDAFRVSVNIGGARSYAGSHRGDPLARAEAWPIRLSYFAREDRGARALLTTETVMDADAVIHAAVLPLAPAALRAELAALRYLDAPTC